MFELYTIDGCSRCQTVKGYMTANAIPFVEKNLMEEHRFVDELIRLNDAIVTPALVENGRVYTNGAIDERFGRRGMQK